MLVFHSEDWYFITGLYAKTHHASPVMISDMRGLLLTLIIQRCAHTYMNTTLHTHAHMCTLILCSNKFSFRMQWTDPHDMPILFPLCSIIGINLMSQFYKLCSHIHCSLMLLCKSVAPVSGTQQIYKGFTSTNSNCTLQLSFCHRMCCHLKSLLQLKYFKLASSFQNHSR
jgi:hypothetical protein